MKVTNVKCMVRVRPLSKKEINEGAEKCMLAVDKTIAARDSQFTYDYVFPENVEQIEVYEKTVSPMVDKLFDGFNQTVFAYGQTGSGKTFTMGGEYGNHINEEIMGIIPRVASAIFEKIDKIKGEYTVVCQTSYFELYKEDIRDLLKPETSPKLLQVREQPNGQTIVSDLSEHPVLSSENMLEMLKKGNTNRSVGATEMNAVSSRSHACFTITLEQQNKETVEDSKCSMLRLIDLAGSERLKRTKAEGQRKEEGVQINLGLLALGNVISALSDGSGHISYRDSKLTRILKDSLGGNSHTLMIACVSPADTNYEESLNTLRYADRARKIKNKPIQNRDPVQAELIQLRKELQIMRANGGGGMIQNIEETDEYQDMKDRLEKELEDYKKAFQTTTNRNQNLLLQIESAQKDKEKVETMLSTIRKNAESLKQEHNNMTVIGEQLDQMEEDPHAAEVYRALRDLHNSILHVEQQNNKRRISFALLSGRNINADPCDTTEESIDEHSDEEDCQQSPNEKLFASHKLNIDIVDINTEIETKEENLKKLMFGEENHHLVKARMERQISELNEKLTSVESEKHQLVVQLNSSKTEIAKKTTPKSSKRAEQMRLKVKELEREKANLEKDKKEKERLLKDKVHREKLVQRLQEELNDLKKKKVEFMKQAKESQKRFQRLKLDKDKEIKALTKAERRQKNEMQKMERQNERIQNVLRKRTQEAHAAEKKYKELMAKKHKAQAERARSGRTMTFHDTKEKISSELELKKWTLLQQHQMDLIKKERAELQKRKGNVLSEKDRNVCDAQIRQKSAELAHLQRIVQENEAQPNPCTAKQMPIKDVAEARKIIEFLFETCVEKAAGDCLHKTASEDAQNKISNLRHELTLAHQQVTNGHSDHREEIIALQNQSIKLEQKNKHLTKKLNYYDDYIKKCNIPRPTYPANSPLKNVNVKNEIQSLPRPTMASRLVQVKKESAEEDTYSPLRNYNPETPRDDHKADPSFSPTNERNPRRRTQAAAKRISDTKIEADETTILKRSMNDSSNSSCSCKGDCSTRRCRCRKAEGKCDNMCNCDLSKCSNRVEQDAKDKENIPAYNESATYDISKDDYKENDTINITPEKANITRTIVESPVNLDVTSTKGLGRNNLKAEAFTPKKAKLFKPARQPRAALGDQSKRTVKLPSSRHPAGDDILTPKK